VFEHAGQTIHFVLPSAVDHISKTILAAKNFYEAELLEALHAELAPGDVVLDVGANLGNHTVYFAKIAGCRVAAFEAHPVAFGFLQDNVRINGLEDRVDAYHLAVSDAEGRVSIVAEMDNNLGATRFGMDADGTVRAVKLDDMDLKRPVRLMKIDVEGMECEVLRGARELIARDRPLIVCEAQTQDEFHKIWAILEPHGYAAAGCFNATATFLFMPAHSVEEQRKLARHEAAEILRTQMNLRAASTQLRVLQKVVDQQTKTLGQLTTRVSGDPAVETSKGLAGEFKGLSGKVDTFGKRLEQSHSSLVEALAAFTRQAEHVAALAKRAEQAESWIEATKPVIGARGEVLRAFEDKIGTHDTKLGTHDATLGTHDATLQAHDTSLSQIRATLSEANTRIDQAKTAGVRGEAELARLDRRMSEQVRVGKDTTSELRADLRAKLQRIERLEAELMQQRGRLDALFSGRIFTWLRRAKSALRFVLWPALKLAGRVPPKVQAQPVAAAPSQPAVVARAAASTPALGASNVAATVADATPVAAGLVDIPYMRRPLASLRRDFLEFPLAANALVSVVMTTYNTEQFVRAAAESILAQTHRNLELIVVDDCSTDGTRAIVTELAARDPRVKLVSFGVNRGTYWCKNFGITQAKGAAITFMDSDDVSEPERIAKQLALLREAGTAVTTCLHERRDEAGTLIAVNGRTQRIAYISQMMRRDVFEVIGYFDSVRTSADDEMLRRIKRTFGDTAHRNVHEVLYKALVHGASLTQDPDNRGISAQPGALAAPRKAYSDAVDAWHADLAKRGAFPFVPFPVVRRPFAVDQKLFVDRTGVSNEHISVCLASFPPRKAALRQVVASLIDQVDRIYIYLNQYDEVPSFLKHPRITVKTGGEDLRDNGKFFYVPELPSGYVFTVDDDIVYPPDYVQSLIRKIELYGRKAVVGLHGTIFANPLVTYFADRALLHFKHPLERDRIVDQLGTGTVAFHTSLWRPAHTEFASTGMVDAWLAVGAARRGISMVAVGRKRNWLHPIPETNGAPTLFDEYRGKDGPQTELVKQVAWSQAPSPALGAVVATRIAAGGQAYAQSIFEADVRTLATSVAALPARSATAAPVKRERIVGAGIHPRVLGTLRVPADADLARLEGFVVAIADQLDELAVVVAPAQDVPGFIASHPRVHVVESDATDERAHFAAIEGFRGYVAPLDLAIDYPPHYVCRLVDAIDRYGRKAAVGWLGTTPAGDARTDGDRQVRTLALPLSAFHTDTLRVGASDIGADETAIDAFARVAVAQGAPLVELEDAPVGTRADLHAQYERTFGAAPPAQADASQWMPMLHAPYRRPTFRMAIVGRTDRARWKKGGILKSTHLTADMLRPYGVDVALVDLETGDPHTLDGHEADLVMIYPGDPERPDFVKVLQLVDEHARAGRAVLVNLSLNNRSTRKRFICDQMLSWRAQYGKRVAMMVFSDRVFDDPELELVRDSIVAIPKTLQMAHPQDVDFHATSGIFLGDYGKLCDESLLAWRAEDAIAVLRDAVPHAHLFAVQQYKPKVKKDLGVEILPFLTDDFNDVLSRARLMVSLVKYATFEMVPLEVAGLGVPLLHAKMENSISDYMGLGALEVTSLDRLGTYAKLVYDDPLAWSALSRAGHAITHGLDWRNMSAQMYLRLLQFLVDSGVRTAD
jgi:FkbM family methyltransferase